VMILLKIVSRRKGLVRLVSIHIDLLVFIIFVGSSSMYIHVSLDGGCCSIQLDSSFYFTNSPLPCDISLHYVIGGRDGSLCFRSSAGRRAPCSLACADQRKVRHSLTYPYRPASRPMIILSSFPHSINS
jgi:hypothetical protein